MTIVQTPNILHNTLHSGCSRAGCWGRHAAVMWRLDGTGHWALAEVGPICAVVSDETEDDCWTPRWIRSARQPALPMIAATAGGRGTLLSETIMRSLYLYRCFGGMLWPSAFDHRLLTMVTDHWFNKKLSYCWETVQRESMPRIAEMDVEMTT